MSAPTPVFNQTIRDFLYPDRVCDGCGAIPGRGHVDPCPVDQLETLAHQHTTLRDKVERLEAENAEVERERDLAIAHDRQPYPTAWAYEQATRALQEHKDQLQALRDKVEQLEKENAGLHRQAMAQELRKLRTTAREFLDAWATPGRAEAGAAERLRATLDWEEAS